MITDMIINSQRMKVNEYDRFCYSILDVWLKPCASNYLILVMIYKQFSQMFSYLRCLLNYIKQSQQPTDCYTNCYDYSPWICLKASGIAALKLKRSAHAQMKQSKINTSEVTREGEDGREMGTEPREDDDTNTEKWVRDHVRLPQGTGAVLRHRIGLDPVADGKHREWGHWHLNGGPDFPCWTSRLVVVTDCLRDSYKDGPRNSYTEPQ